MTLANKISELRSHNGYSKRYVSKNTGISRATLGRIERGTYNPRYDTLLKIARFYGLTPEELIEGAY